MERDRLRKLVADMVAIPSVNPLDAPPGEGTGEADLAAFVERRLVEAGVAVEEVPAAPGRPSVVARLPGEREDAIWFDAHLDTVSAEGMTDPFVPRVEGDILHGRGAADDKGSLAAMMAALISLAEAGVRPPSTIILTATADEEHRMRGLLSLLDSGLQAGAAIVGEPSGLAIITAHKGVARFKVATRGKAAHSSHPEAGVNAIYGMRRVLDALEAYAKRGVGREIHPVLGKATLSVGVIRGGKHANVVPDYCEIEVDRRLLPGEEGRRAVADVRTYLSDVIQEDLEMEVIGPDIVVPALDLSTDTPLVQAVSAQVKQVIGRSSLEGMSGTTHAGQLVAHGIPAVVLGPGAMGQAHTTEEQLELQQLEQAAGIYEGLMRGWVQP